MPHISDAALDFAFLPSAGGIAGTRVEVVFAGKSEKAWLKPDQPAVMPGDSRSQIIVPDFPADTAEDLKSVNVAAGKSLEAFGARVESALAV